MAALCGANDKSEAQQRSAIIDKELRELRKQVNREVRLLLLGTGESGKSTITKQMKIICMDGFSNEEKEDYRRICQANIIEAIATLVRVAEKFGHRIPSHLQPVAAKFKNIPEEDATEHLNRAIVQTFLNKETAAGVAQLWRDPAIQHTYELRAQFQLPGSVDYLLDHAERLLGSNDPIDNSDILHARVATRGIVEVPFELDRMKYRVVDVGGQRSERKKWIQCFASVTAVIFCVALNEYDEKLFEDQTVNRMTEAIQLFKEISNNRFFNDPREPTSIIIFLNKSDLFETKLQKVPLSTRFPDYKGGADVQAGAEYILQVLLKQCENTKDKLMFHHITCATNTDNIKKVFDAVRMTLMNRVLEDAQVL